MAVVSVRGAREHNLRGVDLDLPRERLVVLCGVSGSGKSSFAFDTLHAEGQRRYLEALALHRAGLPLVAPPNVDRIDGLPPTVALAQRTGPPSPRATVGTVAELDPVLRVLFGRAGTLHCPTCGRPIVPTTHDAVVAELLRLPEGERLTLEAPLRSHGRAVVAEVERAGFSRIRVDDEVLRIDEVDPRRLERASRVRVVVDRLKVEPDRRARLHDSVRTAARAGQGVIVAVTEAGERTFVDRPYCVDDDLELPPLEPRLLSPFQAVGACPACEGTGRIDEGLSRPASPVATRPSRTGPVAPSGTSRAGREGPGRERACGTCGGSRLSPVARGVRWRDRTLPDLERLRLSELRAFLASIEPDAVEAVALPDLVRRLAALERLGLGALVAGAPADRLSPGELRRIRLARQVASPLSGVCYVLDEPTAGLDPALVGAVVELLRELADTGSTVLVVEHRPEVIRAADRVIEFGPGAGLAGGQVIYQGDLAGLLAADTPTGRWLSGRARLSARPPPPDRGTTLVRGLWLRERPGPDVVLPRGRVVAITGPAGSGKSALLDALAAGFLADLGRTVVADRAAAAAPRSNPATYLGAWDVLRELLAATNDAKVRALGPSAFSLNTTGGRCESCKGTGERTVELGPLPDVVQVCPVCSGRRFQADVLEVRWKGLDAAQLLELPAEPARALLAGHPKLDAALRALVRVGLGYLPLGQPVHTLSGGESRRLVLARELARAQRRGAEDTVYLLDDPTSGLHPEDVAGLVGLLRELTDEGASVWVATHDPLLIGAADAAVRLPQRPMDNFADDPGASRS